MSSIQPSRSSRVSFLETSHTARIPPDPSKYASLSRAWSHFSPMISQIIMSTFTSWSPSGEVEDSSFLETVVPTVWMYLSSNKLCTNFRMSSVLPVQGSPTMHTFAFTRRDSDSSGSTGVCVNGSFLEH